MKPSQKMMTYSLVRQKIKKIRSFQPFQHLIIIHTILIPHPQVYYILTHLRYYLRLVKNIYVLKEGKSDQAARCIRSRIMTKVIDSVLSIDKFEQKFVVLKGMLQSPRMKDHVHTIGIEP